MSGGFARELKRQYWGNFSWRLHLKVWILSRLKGRWKIGEFRLFVIPSKCRWQVLSCLTHPQIATLAHFLPIFPSWQTPQHWKRRVVLSVNSNLLNHTNLQGKNSSAWNIYTSAFISFSNLEECLYTKRKLCKMNMGWQQDKKN